MSVPSQLTYLRHVRDALSSVREYTATGREVFFASKMVQDAVIRNLEIVGEAVKGLEPATRGLAPQIPWRRIAGMRDHLAHHYFGVDLDLVWRVAEVEVDPLFDVVERMISDLE